MVHIMETKYGEIGDECYASGCKSESTHVVTIEIATRREHGTILSKTAYCLHDALYFAAWLPYCYPGEYELISIAPPVSELFDRS